MTSATRGANRAPGPSCACDVLVVGGGPVGLLLANLLGQRGCRCIVIERRQSLPGQSMAIGITPPSLRILAGLGLDAVFIDRGLRITEAFVHDHRGCLGGVTFRTLPDPYPFILSLPQADTIHLLERSLRRFPTVELRRSLELESLRSEGKAAIAVLRDVRTGETETCRAGYLVGADGARGIVRSLAGIGRITKDYGLSFAMADFVDESGLGGEAHLFFVRRGSVESFPLPGRRRRWIVRTREGEDVESVAERVKELTGYDLSGAERLCGSRFRVTRSLARRYVRGPVVLCGDAAHVMSPVGGQGMNTGFADAELLAAALDRALRDPDEAPRRLRDYERYRRRAFRVAAARAARGMWLGTRTGRLLSGLRSLFIRALLGFRPLAGRLPPYFAMLTIPSRSLGRSLARLLAVSTRSEVVAAADSSSVVRRACRESTPSRSPG